MEAGVECCIGDADGEVVWIELFAKPLDLFGVFRVGGVGKDLEQFFITPGGRRNPLVDSCACRRRRLDMMLARVAVVVFR